MITASQEAEQLLLAEGRLSRLITRADEVVRMSARRDTDVRTSLTRALADYLTTLRIDFDGGRESRFMTVQEVWGESEQPIYYPAAAVIAVEEGTYDASRFTPHTYTLGEGRFVREVAEFSQPITVEIWATDPKERMALVTMCEDAFDPVEFMTGFRLEMPHYFNQRATFEKMTLEYDDNEEAAQRRDRRAIFRLMGTTSQVRPIGFVPEMQVNYRYDVADGNIPGGFAARTIVDSPGGPRIAGEKC